MKKLERMEYRILKNENLDKISLKKGYQDSLEIYNAIIEFKK